MNIREDYTRADVIQLVEAVQSTKQAINEGIRLSPGGGHREMLTDALAPFLRDQDEEILKKIEKLRYAKFNTSEGNRAILAAVREHDREHAK